MKTVEEIRTPWPRTDALDDLTDGPFLQQVRTASTATLPPWCSCRAAAAQGCPILVLHADGPMMIVIRAAMFAFMAPSALVWPGRRPEAVVGGDADKAH